MAEEKNLLNEISIGNYNASDRPFDFVETDAETALVCEPDETVREKISNALKNLGFQITKVSSALEALKSMRFHVYDVIIVDEIIDPSVPDRNDVLAYLEKLSITTRRQIFVALLSNTYRTMDNMSAFNRSVNVTINMKNIDDVGVIIKRAVADNAAFYRVFRDTLKKMGRI
jgi:CheY-like chemotaxis protein